MVAQPVGDKQQYRTPDLYLCAFLVCHGAKIRTLEPDRMGMVFVLEHVGEAALDGFLGDASVPIRAYLAAIREAKAALQTAQLRRGWRGGR
jgi:hypothetical protein